MHIEMTFPTLQLAQDRQKVLENPEKSYIKHHKKEDVYTLEVDE